MGNRFAPSSSDARCQEAPKAAVDHADLVRIAVRCSCQLSSARYDRACVMILIGLIVDAEIAAGRGERARVECLVWSTRSTREACSLDRGTTGFREDGSRDQDREASRVAPVQRGHADMGTPGPSVGGKQRRSATVGSRSVRRSAGRHRHPLKCWRHRFTASVDRWWSTIFALCRPRRLVVAEGSTLPAWALSAGIAEQSRALWLIPTALFQRALLLARGTPIGVARLL